MQLKEGESEVQSQTFTMGDKRRIFYQPQGTIQTLLQHRKLLDGGQEEKEGPALPRMGMGVIFLQIVLF